MSARAIVLGFTADYAFAAGVLLSSIFAHNPNLDTTVVILHDGLDESLQAAFLRLYPRCTFRSFTKPHLEARLGIATEDPRLAPYLARFSPLVLAKLELPALLDEFERVVWLDADMLVRGPLDGLWDFDCLAWRPLRPGAFARREKALQAFADLKLDPSITLFNGGVIGVSRRFRDLGGTGEMIYQMARQLVERAPALQLAELPWYLTAASLGLPVTALPMRLNHSVGAPGVAGATIIHAIGPHKFWNATPLAQLFPDWFAHQAHWVASGGAPYAGPLTLSDTHPAEASDVLKAAQTRAYWLSVFTDLRAVLPKGMVFDLRHDRRYLLVFLHGRPEAQHFCLVRQSSERRMGLEAHLPEDLMEPVLEAISQSVTDLRWEKHLLMSMPVEQIGAALAAANAVLDPA